MKYDYIKNNIIKEAAEKFTATYEILKNFTIPNGDGWNIIFYKGNKIKISYKNREITFYNQNTKNWERKDLDYQNFMEHKNISKFNTLSKKIQSLED